MARSYDTCARRDKRVIAKNPLPVLEGSDVGTRPLLERRSRQVMCEAQAGASAGTHVARGDATTRGECGRPRVDARGVLPRKAPPLDERHTGPVPGQAAARAVRAGVPVREREEAADERAV